VPGFVDIMNDGNVIPLRDKFRGWNEPVDDWKMPYSCCPSDWRLAMASVKVVPDSGSPSRLRTSAGLEKPGGGLVVGEDEGMGMGELGRLGEGESLRGKGGNGADCSKLSMT